MSDKTGTVAPVRPPKEWFDDPKLAGPTPLTVTPTGRVFGHAALWDSCHRTYGDRCVTPPRSRSSYSQFHLGAIETADGGEIPVGKITAKCGHASTAAGVGRMEAADYYDKTGTVAAYVKAGEDAYGIWLAGSLRPGLSPEDVVELRGNPISGDWRGGELIAATCVPVPGFQVPRLAASFRLDEPVALVASFSPGIVVQELSLRAREILNKRPASSLLRPKSKPKPKPAAIAKAKPKPRPLPVFVPRAAAPPAAAVDLVTTIERRTDA